MFNYANAIELLKHELQVCIEMDDRENATHIEAVIALLEHEVNPDND